MTKTRGIRNNNPGNIRYNKEKPVKWLGLDTIRKIINRYAPESENDTDAYVKSVCTGLGVGADVVISVYTPSIMEKLIKAIIKFENGEQPYSDEQIIEGIRLL